MEITPIVLALALIVTTLIGLGVGAAVFGFAARRRDDVHRAQLRQAVAELAGQRDAQVNAAVEQALNAAGTTFDGRLQTGTADLEHRQRAFDEKVAAVQQRIDEQLGGVVTQLEGKLATVDQLVSEKVGGMSDVVGERVGGMSKALGQQVSTMGGDLRQLRTLVSDLQKEREAQHRQMLQGLESAARQNQELVSTTQQLREALASPQARGQWGERMAEDVLRAAGLREGINYKRQQTLTEGTKPDFTFLLPDERILHMDVKFPVTNYLRYLETESPTDQQAHRTQFLRDVRARVKELHGRGYANEEQTVGYLLLFIPNESVYGFIHEHDADLLDDALSQQVVLCSPTTLFAVLGVIRQAMDNFAVERASAEILDCLGAFGDQWTKFSEQIDKVDKHIGTLTNSFTELSGPRRRQLERQLGRIEDVRARAGIDDASSGVLDADRPVLREVSGG